MLWVAFVAVGGALLGSKAAKAGALARDAFVADIRELALAFEQRVTGMLRRDRRPDN